MLDRILRAIPSWRVKQMQRALPRTLARLTYQSFSPHGWPKEIRTKGAARSFVHFVCSESPSCTTTPTHRLTRPSMRGLARDK